MWTQLQNVCQLTVNPSLWNLFLILFFPQLDVFIQARRCQIFTSPPVPICQCQSFATPPAVSMNNFILFSCFMWFYIIKYTIREGLLWANTPRNWQECDGSVLCWWCQPFVYDPSVDCEFVFAFSLHIISPERICVSPRCQHITANHFLSPLSTVFMPTLNGDICLLYHRIQNLILTFLKKIP